MRDSPTPTTGPSGLVERVADEVCKARCSCDRPDPGKGLDEFIANAILALPEFAALTPQPDAGAVERVALNERIVLALSDPSTKPEVASLVRDLAALSRQEPDAGAVERVPSFEKAWARYEAKGYQYGRDALENVEFGYWIALEELAALVPADPAKGET